MEQELKEYFAKLSKNFWQPGNNLKIKHELGYDEEPDVGDMSWFFRVFNRPHQPEEKDLIFTLNFYRFYQQLLDDEPSMIDFLRVIPLSYHKLLIEKCADAYDALTIMPFVIEKDWTKEELQNYFEVNRN